MAKSLNITIGPRGSGKTQKLASDLCLEMYKIGKQNLPGVGRVKEDDHYLLFVVGKNNQMLENVFDEIMFQLKFDVDDYMHQQRLSLRDDYISSYEIMNNHRKITVRLVNSEGVQYTVTIHGFTTRNQETSTAGMPRMKYTSLFIDEYDFFSSSEKSCVNKIIRDINRQLIKKPDFSLYPTFTINIYTTLNKKLGSIDLMEKYGNLNVGLPIPKNLLLSSQNNPNCILRNFYKTYVRFGPLKDEPFYMYPLPGNGDYHSASFTSLFDSKIVLEDHFSKIQHAVYRSYMEPFLNSNVGQIRKENANHPKVLSDDEITPGEPKTWIDHDEVFEAIISERNYQDEIWNGTKSSRQPSDAPNSMERTIDEYALHVARYANRLVEVCGTTDHPEKKLEIFRKIAALCVACGETHGMPRREEKNN